MSSLKWQIYSYFDFLSNTKSKLVSYIAAQNTCVTTREPNQQKRERERAHGTIDDIAGHGLYRHLWAVRACSNQRHVLIGSWATSSMTNAIQIKQGGVSSYGTIDHGKGSHFFNNQLIRGSGQAMMMGWGGEWQWLARGTGWATTVWQRTSDDGMATERTLPPPKQQ